MDNAEEAGDSVWILQTITVTIAKADSAMRPFRPIQVPVRYPNLSAYFSHGRLKSQKGFRRILEEALEDIFGGVGHLEAGTPEAWRTTFTLTGDGTAVYGSWMVEQGMVRDGGK